VTPVIEGIICGESPDLAQVIGDFSDLVLSDLTLGAWRPHAIARELLAQLGVLAEHRVSQGLAPGSGSYSDLVGQLIDMETAGDSLTKTAYSHASVVADQLALSGCQRVVILGLGSRLEWEHGSILFLRFLRERFVTGRVIIVTRNEKDVPEELNVSWQIHRGSRELVHERSGATIIPSVLPGILDGPTVSELCAGDGPSTYDLIELRQKQYLVPPGIRRIPDAVSAERFDDIAERLSPDHWGRSFALCHGTGRNGAAPALYSYASRAFAEGDWDLGIKLLSAAVPLADSELQGWIVKAQLQGMRIATARFADVCSVDLPPITVPNQLRGFLMQSKAWALVMTGRAAEAKELFEQALSLLDDHSQTRTYLYLLNIYALTCMRLNRIDEAIALEKRIEKQLLENHKDDFHLGYINSLNTARLMRRTGDLDAAHRYYERAFQTCEGSCSESDFVFKNTCQGFLADISGQHVIANSAWIRAACHWLAMEVPESLAPRVVRLILNDTPGNFVEAVSGVLLTRLVNSGQKIGLDCSTECGPVASCPRFAYTEKLRRSDIHKAAAVGADGWGLIAAASDITLRSLGPLRAQLGRILVTMTGGLLDVDWHPPEGCVMFVDHQNGRELPTNLPELLVVAASANIERVVWKGRTLVLGESLRAEVFSRLTMRIGPAVKSLFLTASPPYVTFKRYLSPRILSPTEAFLLTQGECVSVADLAARHPDLGVQNILRKLAIDRVIEHSADQACVDLLIK
jgi:tetratricopeptide (TPR) repeat protein